MLDYSTIRDLASEAGMEARQAGKSPLNIREFDPGKPMEFLKRIPNLGDYVPDGWKRDDNIDPYFVDSTGINLNDSGGSSLSINGFIQVLNGNYEIRDEFPHGYGITECGQFQLYIEVFVPIQKKELNLRELKEFKPRANCRIPDEIREKYFPKYSISFAAFG